MLRHVKISLSRWWWMRVVFASALAISVLTWHQTLTLAAACNPTTPLNAAVSNAVCDMSIAATVSSGVLTLSNDTVAVVTGTPFTIIGTSQTPVFSFTSIVKDHRGVTAGWALEAASTGLSLNTTTFSLSLTGENGSTCTNGTCPAVTFLPITLTATPAKFLQAGVVGAPVVVDGDYTNNTLGSFTIPPGSPSGAYSGTINVTLANAY